MATTSYNLRTRLNGQSPSIRTTPTATPSAFRSGSRSPRKQNPPPVSLKLQKVIGSTTTSPTGLAYCAATNSYAYCAGSVAVLVQLHTDGQTTKRYYRARPSTLAVNPTSSHYSTGSPSSTPARRRTSIFTPLRSRDRESTAGIPRDWEDGSSQTWTARERIKTISCVALSQDGKWLAVGESGYSPRVLLYSTADDASTDIPISIVADHAIGVKSVAFSSDGRYLATLGNLNDGFLFIWSINSRTGQLALYAANKCTTNVCGMTWIGTTLVTVGTRHVKAWLVNESANASTPKRSKLRASTGEMASPGPATLIGRNALLGSLVDCTFTAVIAVDSRALLTSDAGHLCMFQPDGPPDVQILKTFDFCISSIGWQSSTGRVILGGRGGLLYEDYDGLLAHFHTAATRATGTRSTNKRARASAIRMSLGLQYGESVGISAVACLPAHTISLDTDGNLQVESSLEESNQPTVAFASHSDLIQGVQSLPAASELGMFYTWSRKGELKFWDTGGSILRSIRVDLCQSELDIDNDPNELRIARLDDDSRRLVLGDRLGVMRLYDLFSGQSIWTGRAHGAEINDITIEPNKSIVVSCGRDRMVQVFSLETNELLLLQTLDDHIGSVTKALFSQNGDRLLTGSADRTIIIRERSVRAEDSSASIAYLTTRIVTMKSTPLSMAFVSHDTMLVSTNDRYVARVDLAAGTIMDNIKIIDLENDDTVALSSMSYSCKGAGKDELMDLMLAASATDKSIRVYDANNCSLLTRESGHTEGISDLCLIENAVTDDLNTERTLVSTGLDGTIMIWRVLLRPLHLTDPTCELSQSQSMSNGVLDATPTKANPASLPPLRKVLSKVETLNFARSVSGVPDSARSLSPPRMTRKGSQLALSSTISESDESIPGASSNRDQKASHADHQNRRAGSPDSPKADVLPNEQRSKAIPNDQNTPQRSQRNRSVSPSRVAPLSLPNTPRRTQANNGRLRRPPSILSDLRNQALSQRRQSTSQASEFGSIAMATEQATRMLKTFRKKLVASKEHIDLNELEDELEQVMKMVKERKPPTGTVSLNGTMRRSKMNDAVQPSSADLEDLAVLLDRTNLAERSPRMTNDGEGMKV